VWGLDLAGQQNGKSLDDAGGVGGLVMANPFGGRPVFCASDLQGNVTTLIDALNGTVTGRFEYSPFGELLRATGPAAAQVRLRFSTKYEDAETGWVYYGHRFYDPIPGRWLSRDPLEEQGGLNLYAFANNNAPNYYDVDGRFIGFFIGVGVDLAVQISVNVATGKDWYDINVSSVIISGAVGIVAPGVGQIVKGVKNAGRLSSAISKTQSKIPLRKNPMRVDRLNRRLQRQVKAHNQQVNQVARDVSIAAAWQASKFVMKKMADEIENEVKNMDGCPNDGYGLGASDALEERVAVDPFSWNPFKHVDGWYYEHNGVPSEITIER
jgi:RHS repeat-associated protein